MKRTYYFDFYAMGYQDIGGTEINPGDPVLVFTATDVITGEECWKFRKDFAKDGYPGNLDSSERCFHGWRGTTNNTRIYAYGVYRVDSVEEIKKRNRWGCVERYVKVVLGKKDIKADED